MTQPTGRRCFFCGAPNSSTARFCSACGNAISGDVEPEAVLLPGAKRLNVSSDVLSLRELLAMVESGIYWWQQRLHHADTVNRERAAAAIKDLSNILESLSQQLAQGRETVRITSRLPAVRVYELTCPICGRGNRASARYCVACGSLFANIQRGALQESAQNAPLLLLNIAMRTDVGKVRQNNEDSCYAGRITTSDGMQSTLLIVADGMGGAQAGEEASRLASEAVKQALVDALRNTNPNDDQAWQTLLRQAAIAANQRVYAAAQANRNQRGMGTTLTIALIANNRIHLAHIGDSRAYVLNAYGVTTDGSRLLQLTADHTLVARLVDIGQLSNEEARTHPNRNMLYRALGADATIEADASSQALNAGDILVLCSDGLTVHVNDQELLDIALSGASSQNICDQLVDLANQRGGRDNISVIVARATLNARRRAEPTTRS